MNSEQSNYWFVVAAWWILMIVFGAMISLPALGWDPVMNACKLLSFPGVVLFVFGLVLNNPKRYLFCLATIGAFWVVPLLLVCLTPVALLVYTTEQIFTAVDIALFISAFACLSLWFVAMRLMRDARRKIASAESHVFLEDGVAYIKFADLQGKHTSNGDQQYKFLASPIAGLAALGYPLQKFLAWKVGSTAVIFLIAILLTPLASWLLAWMICKFFSWALPIWRYERTQGNRVYLKRPEKPIQVTNGKKRR